jgi:hypothetical protein
MPHPFYAWLEPCTLYLYLYIRSSFVLSSHMAAGSSVVILG